MPTLAVFQLHVYRGMSYIFCILTVVQCYFYRIVALTGKKLWDSILGAYVSNDDVKNNKYTLRGYHTLQVRFDLLV